MRKPCWSSQGSGIAAWPLRGLSNALRDVINHHLINLSLTLPNLPQGRRESCESGFLLLGEQHNNGFGEGELKMPHFIFFHSQDVPQSFARLPDDSSTRIPGAGDRLGGRRRKPTAAARRQEPFPPKSPSDPFPAVTLVTFPSLKGSFLESNLLLPDSGAFRERHRQE